MPEVPPVELLELLLEELEEFELFEEELLELELLELELELLDPEPSHEPRLVHEASLPGTVFVYQLARYRVF